MSDAGKTEFRIRINVPKEEVNRVIQQYLFVNEFQLQQRGNIFFYQSKRNGILKTFEYYLNDYELLVLAYLGTFEKPVKLEGMIFAISKQIYKRDIMMLFGEINKIRQYQQAPSMQTTGMQKPGVQMPYGNYANNTGYVNGNSINVFMEANERKKEMFAIIGFVLSFLGFLASCLGSGAFIIFLELWFAEQGLKTRKKVFSIATMVIAGISIIILTMVIIIKLVLIFVE